MILLWVTGSMKLLSLGSARFKRLCFSSLCCINVMQEPKGHVPIDDTTHTHTPHEAGFRSSHNKDMKCSGLNDSLPSGTLTAALSCAGILGHVLDFIGA